MNSADRPVAAPGPGQGQASAPKGSAERTAAARAADLHWLERAIVLAKLCPPSSTAFSVGAVIVGIDGEPLSTGYSRESDPLWHAEETALGKLPPGDPRLRGATIYSSLEPCGQRASRPRTCSRLIIDAGIPRVVLAWREPDLFVAGNQGTGLLVAAGVEVVELPELAAAARAVNAHLGL